MPQEAFLEERSGRDDDTLTVTAFLVLGGNKNISCGGQHARKNSQGKVVELWTLARAVILINRYLCTVKPNTV